MGSWKKMKIGSLLTRHEGLGVQREGEGGVPHIGQRRQGLPQPGGSTAAL